MIWVVLALIGCRNDFGVGQGASGVGNPGSAKQEAARGNKVTTTAATVYTQAFDIDRCSADDVVVDLDRPVDLLDDAPIEVPGGRWCGLGALWTPPLVLEGANENGEPGKGTFRFELDVTAAALVVDPGFKVDGDDLILELGYPGWFQDRVELEDRTHTEIGPGDSLHDVFAEQIELGSALYVDEDSDGTISEDERAAGALASGPLHVPTELDDD